ncbi:MAG TPA: hypothetical protein VFV30_02905 [Novosphingobium sp.]|nr:hypothetical protein [Novosphingobium sp.]
MTPLSGDTPMPAVRFAPLALAAAALAFAVPGAVHAAGKGNANGHGSHAGHAGHAPAAKKPPKAARAKPCPPGLAKKNTGCLPPGQWRKGDRLPDAWAAQFIAYAALPDFYRSRYPAQDGRRYLYRDGRVFVVDAITRTIVDVILR